MSKSLSVIIFVLLFSMCQSILISGRGRKNPQQLLIESCCGFHNHHPSHFHSFPDTYPLLVSQGFCSKCLLRYRLLGEPRCSVSCHLGIAFCEIELHGHCYFDIYINTLKGHPCLMPGLFKCSHSALIVCRLIEICPHSPLSNGKVFFFFFIHIIFVLVVCVSQWVVGVVWKL